MDQEKCIAIGSKRSRQPIIIHLTVLAGQGLEWIQSDTAVVHRSQEQPMESLGSLKFPWNCASPGSTCPDAQMGRAMDFPLLKSLPRRHSNLRPRCNRRHILRIGTELVRYIGLAISCVAGHANLE